MCVGGQANFKLCHRILTGRYAASQIALWEDSGSRLEPWTGDPEPEETDVVTLSLELQYCQLYIRIMKGRGVAKCAADNVQGVRWC